MGTIASIKFTHIHKDPMAATLRLFEFRRPDLAGWVAKITGPDPVYKLARTFLPRTYPIGWEKRPDPAFSFLGVRTGDVVQIHGYHSNQRQEDLFIRVLDVNEDTMEYEEVEVGEIYQMMRDQKVLAKNEGAEATSLARGAGLLDEPDGEGQLASEDEAFDALITEEVVTK